MSVAKYYRGPDEPGGSGEVIAEVVDGRLRRRIELCGMAVKCVGYDEYPVNIDMVAISNYVCQIDQEEFEKEWLRYCVSR